MPLYKKEYNDTFLQDYLPISFNDTWARNAIRNIGDNDIQLRNFNQLQPIHSNLVSLDVFPLFNFPKLWQELPNEQIKIIRKTDVFDTKKKKNFLDDLASNVVCNTIDFSVRPAWQVILAKKKVN